MVFAYWFTIQTVPSTSGIIAGQVTATVSKVIATIDIVVGIALHFGSGFAISSIKKTFFGVASLVTSAVLEDFPTGLSSPGGGVTIFPRINTQATIKTVVVAGMGVALFVATIIAGFAVAFVFDTLLFFLVRIVVYVSAVGFVNASGTGTVANVTVLTTPFRLARAIVVTHFVNAMTFVLARIISTFVTSVLLTSFACCSGRAAASKVCSIIAVHAGPSVATG